MNTRERKECIEHALKEIDRLSNDLAEHGKASLSKRADTVIHKLLDLMELIAE